MNGDTPLRLGDCQAALGLQVKVLLMGRSEGTLHHQIGAVEPGLQVPANRAVAAGYVGLMQPATEARPPGLQR